MASADLHLYPLTAEPSVPKAGNPDKVSSSYGRQYIRDGAQLVLACPQDARESSSGAVSPDHSRGSLAAAECPQDRGDSGDFSVWV